MPTAVVNIPRKEYQKLKQQARAYQQLAGVMFSSAVKNSIEDVVDDFRNTKLYSEEFLTDLKSGLKRSNYQK